MEDFNALAAVLGSGIPGVRGCLILSRDGLVLGAHPAAAETEAKPAWIRLAALGEPERGFLQFGTEVWCFVRRGPYAAFVLSGAGVRPGLVLDQIEQALLVAEEARARREGLRVELGEGTPMTPGRPRTPLHPEPRPLVITQIEQPSLDPDVPAVTPTALTETEPTEPPEPAPAPAPEAPGQEAEVDRFSLAREFSQLLQEQRDPADGKASRTKGPSSAW